MPNQKQKQPVYEVKFKRLASELGMDVVLRRPYSDEVEDYQEYKRLRQMARDQQDETMKARQPAVTVAQDDGSDDRVGGWRRFAALGPFGRVDSMQGAHSDDM